MSETPPNSLTGATFYRAPPARRRPAWRTAAWIGVAILVAIAAAWLLTPHGQNHGRGGGRGGAGGANGRNAPTVVGLATAVRGDIPIVLSALGTVTSEATVTVNTQIAGTLMKVDFKEGQIVHKGQLIAEVDTRPYVVALAQAEGQLARDQAALADARLDLKRYQTLAAQDSIASQQVDTQAAAVKQDEGTVKTDEANVASAKLNLVYCHIVAPVSGRVGLRQVDAGNYISTATATGIVIITQFDPIDVVFSLPEDDIPQIAARTSKGAVLTATVLDRTGTTTLGQGALMTLDNQVDTTTGTVKAKARFANPNGALFPDQFVNVQLLVDTLKNVVVVPSSAVRNGSTGDYVFVLDQDPLTGGNIARQVSVKVGPGQGDKTSIASGLQPGDQVITDGGDRLTDGATVLLPGQAPADFARPHPKTGLFGWLGGLFGHKTAAGEQAGAASGGGGNGGSPGGTGGGGGRGGARLQAMLDQLNLTPDQKTKIAAIQADATKKIQAAGGDPDAARAARRDSFTQINGLLGADQKAKLAQLRAAARAAYGGGASGGAAASGDQAAPAPRAPSDEAASASPPAAASPGGEGGQRSRGAGGGSGGGLFALLDDDQKAKAKAIFEAARTSGDPAAFKDARSKVEALLRPDQKARLEQMRPARDANGGGGGGAQ